MQISIIFVGGVFLSTIVDAALTPVGVFSTSLTCSASPDRDDVCIHPQYVLEGDHNSPDSEFFRYESWVQVGACHAHEGDNYCAFSNPLFSGGQGISVITTRESIPKIASRSVFRNWGMPVATQSHREALGSSELYEVAKIPDKGFGLVATKTIRDGDLVMTRNPAVVVNANAVSGLNRDYLANLLKSGVESLSDVHRDQYLNLSTHSLAGTYEERIHKIFKTNSFRTGPHDGVSDFHSTFTEGRAAQHPSILASCEKFRG